MPEPRRQRFFTLGEAERILPEVEAAVREVIRLNRDSETLQDEYRQWLQQIAMSGGTVVDHSSVEERKNRMRQIAAHLQDAAAHLENFGCLLKDLNLGLVDFPALFRGREVYLCWKLGEDSIRFWHETGEGFAGRKPIDAEFVRHQGPGQDAPLH